MTLKLQPNQNTCDLCHEVENTSDLVWISAEDFQPFDNEIVPKELYKKYQALCEYCYLKLIKIDTTK